MYQLVHTPSIVLKGNSFLVTKPCSLTILTLHAQGQILSQYYLGVRVVVEKCTCCTD